MIFHTTSKCDVPCIFRRRTGIRGLGGVLLLLRSDAKFQGSSWLIFRRQDLLRASVSFFFRSLLDSANDIAQGLPV